MEIKYAFAMLLVLILNLGDLLTSLANSYCPPPTYPPVPHLPPKHPPHVKPPFHPKPPKNPPPHVKPPIVKPPPSPVVPIKPPPTPTPRTPVIPVTPPSTPPPTIVPSPQPPPKDTCPIDALKLGGCVDVLSGLIHIGIGSSAKDACCPVLQGLADLDAAVCLCTTINAKLLNINIILPIALQVLIDCGKTPPSGFQCPATPPVVKPPPTPIVPVKPPPTSPVVKPPPTPAVPVKPPPTPPVVTPPPTPVVPIKPPPTPPPTETPCPPPPPKAVPSPQPPPKDTCPIDALKLGGCVDVLGGLIHIGIGSSAKDACCPVLQGLADLDAAVCLCTTIKAKLLNINIIIPIALQVLIDCGKTPPSGFQCPA